MTPTRRRGCQILPVHDLGTIRGPSGICSAIPLWVVDSTAAGDSRALCVDLLTSISSAIPVAINEVGLKEAALIVIPRR